MRSWNEFKKNTFEISVSDDETAFLYKDKLRWVFEVRLNDKPMADGTMIQLKAWSKRKAVVEGSKAYVDYCHGKSLNNG